MSSNIRETKDQVNELTESLRRLDFKIDDTHDLLVKTTILLRKLNLPPEIEKAIHVLVMARMAIEQWVRALELAEAAAYSGGPLGWTLALVSLGIATLSTQSLGAELGR